jgi:hypothetical protein
MMNWKTVRKTVETAEMLFPYSVAEVPLRDRKRSADIRKALRVFTLN